MGMMCDACMTKPSKIELTITHGKQVERRNLCVGCSSARAIYSRKEVDIGEAIRGIRDWRASDTRESDKHSELYSLRATGVGTVPAVG